MMKKCSIGWFGSGKSRINVDYIIRKGMRHEIYVLGYVWRKNDPIRVCLEGKRIF